MKRITTVGVLQLSIATAAGAIAIAGSATSARSATLSFVGNAAALGANDTVNWSSPTLTGLPSVSPTNLTIQSTGGLTVTGTQNGGGARIIQQNPTGVLLAPGSSNALQDPTNPATQNGLWNGNFAPNTSVFYSNGNLGGLTLSFSTPVAAVGAQINSLFYRNSAGVPAFQGTLTAFATDGTSQTFENLQGITNANADNSAVFWGVSSDAANISSIVFRTYVTPTAIEPFADNFALGSVLIANPAATAVPEPFTIVGTMIGVASAWKMRKRLKANNKI